MKKLILAAVLLFPLSTSSQSQMIEENLKIYCASTDAIFSGLMEKYKEYPVVAGISGDNMISFWGNDDTKTFTVLLTTKDKKLTCVIVAGDEFSTKLKKSSDNDATIKPNRVY